MFFQCIYNNRELLSTIASLCTIWLGIKHHIASWPISIIIALVNLSIYAQGALYYRLVTGGISIVFSLYGWYQWRYGGPNRNVLEKITTTSSKQFLVIILFGISAFPILSQILIYTQSDFPYQGALCISLVMIGLWMTAHKKLETYAIWSLLNILSIYIHYQKAYYWFSVKYLIYLLGSVYGYSKWRFTYLSYEQKKPKTLVNQ